MRNKQFKKYQRKLNKIIRTINHNLENDNWFNGRYVFRQKCAVYEEFQDKSGGRLCFILRAYDKKSGYYKDYLLDYAPWMMCTNIYMTANDFIIKDAFISSEDYQDNGDYRNVKMPDSVMQKEENFFRSRKYFQIG